MIYTLICIYSTLNAQLHPFYFNHMFIIVKLLFYNNNKKNDTNCHTKHFGICDWVYINFKHIKWNMWDDKKPLKYPRYDI
jgi:hypothetical protein